jgi:hypothetical protein
MENRGLTISQKQTLDETVEKIGVLFTSVKTNVMELAKEISNADKQSFLRVRLKEELKTRNIMDESMYSQLLKLGNKKILYQPHILPFLPRPQTTIYQIAKEFTDQEIEVHVKNKKINELSTTDDIIEIINEKKDKLGSGNKTDRKLFSIKITSDNYKKFNLKK